jgi:hypothetical protein
MSGSAALSAAKRRRGGSDTANTASQPQNSPGKPSQAALSPIQILNQHHNKLDLLYKRQDRINKVLNISDDDDSETNIVERLDNVERQLNIGIPKTNNNIRDTSSKSNDYEEQIKELKELIIKAQSHSIQVSLELALLKKKLQVSDDTVTDTVTDNVTDAVDDNVTDNVDDTVDDTVTDNVDDTETINENDYIVGGEEF